MLVVRADAPWHTLQEFVADMKKQPARFNYGSSGNYGTMHVPMEMLKASAGFRMTHIPYTGAGPAIVALLAGQIDAIASGPSTVVQQIQAGKLRALAHWGEQPLAALPGVPSLAQSGYPVRFAQWSALFVPSRTPDDDRPEAARRGRARRRRPDRAPGGQQGGQPDRVPRRARVPDLLGRRRGGDDAGGAPDRQARVTVGAGGRQRQPRADS